MPATIFTTVTSFEVVLFCKDLVTIGRHVKITIF
jgi:hypothetical protein